MESRIVRFIRKHHLLSLATVGESVGCCSAFYAFDEEEGVLVIASDEQTLHIRNIQMNPAVAGVIAQETKIVGKIQGIQFNAHMDALRGEREKKIYLERFPYALAMNLTLWRIRLDEIKMTDNTLGFGKKLIWKREL